ncbi:hypothetical protein [uncultured Paracoccus sp.]|uniref:hypothetical protein n=1 Tax=uncultured Paracoccus sp. TaxID=189685 RepID=UPI00260B8DF5|nr:hypothetical protein [uncultured Paracoccus sp.]
MIRIAPLLTAAAAAVLLAGMMLTNPDYNSAVRPFETRVPPGETGQTRLIGGRIEGWRTADRISFPAFGSLRQRDTQAMFLIVDLKLFGTTDSTMLRAGWIGASGRRYDTTARISGAFLQIQDLWLQPGLESKAIAIFELPEDEIAGGALMLSDRIDAPLDGRLRLAAPVDAPSHVDHLELDG